MKMAAEVFELVSFHCIMLAFYASLLAGIPPNPLERSPSEHGYALILSANDLFELSQIRARISTYFLLLVPVNGRNKFSSTSSKMFMILLLSSFFYFTTYKFENNTFLYCRGVPSRYAPFHQSLFALVPKPISPYPPKTPD